MNKKNKTKYPYIKGGKLYGSFIVVCSEKKEIECHNLATANYFVRKGC